VPNHPRSGWVVDRHRRQAGIGVQRVGADAGRLRHAVLQKPVDDDDVAANELLRGADALAHDPPVVEDVLQVEGRHEDARVALARRRLADVAQAALEREVGALDGVLEDGPIDCIGDRVHEYRVTLELREA
jgi:hypothetical protein